MRKRGSTVQKALFLVFALSCIPSSPRCGEGTDMGQSWLAYLLNPSAAYAGRLLEVKDFECVQALPAVSGPYQVLWASAFGGSAADSGRAVVPCRDGGFAMAGYTSSYGAGSYDCLVLKLDGTGALQWSRTAGGPKFDQAHAVIETSCGRFIAAGETSSWGEGESDGYVLCYDRDGNLLWSRTYGGPSFDRIRSITETAEGTFVLAGYTSSSGAGHKDFWVLTIDGQGRVKRSGTLGLEGCDEAFSVSAAPDGSLVAAGNTSSAGSGELDCLVIRFEGLQE